MSYRSENDKDDNLDAYYKRKQSVKHNQLRGEAEVLHDADHDAEVRRAGFKGSKAKESPAKGYNPKEHDIWDDAAWKDKEQHE